MNLNDPLASGEGGELTPPLIDPILSSRGRVRLRRLGGDGGHSGTVTSGEDRVVTRWKTFKMLGASKLEKFSLSRPGEPPPSSTNGSDDVIDRRPPVAAKGLLRNEERPRRA